MSRDWQPSDFVFRQVHPSHRTGEHPNSVAFFPTPKDKDLLSVDDSSLVSAEGSWSHFTKALGFQSAGTWAISVEEITTAFPLQLQSDPTKDSVNPEKSNPAHCLIDFSQVTSKGQKKKRAQELALKASARGCQFLPPP